MKKQNIYDYCKVMMKFKLTDYQLAYAFDCINHQYVVAVFCRQSGKSEATAKVAIILADLKPNQKILIIAPTDRQAGLIAEKITNTIAQMFVTSDFYIKRQTQREFYFSNGSSIICDTTGDTGENLRGYTAHAIILEEAGSIKDSIVHSVILPMGATTSAKVIKIGTPRGMNHFYESFRGGEYKLHQIAWKTAVEQGIVKQSYVDEVRAQVPVTQFQTEMEAMFIADEDAYFGYDLVDSCAKDVYQKDKPKPGVSYYLGADIARMGQDSTCMMVMEKEPNEPCKIVKIIDIPKATLDFIIDKINIMDKTWHFKKIYIDETGLGAGVKDVLARSHNPLKQTPGVRAPAVAIADKVIGVTFTIKSKLDIFSNLKVLMEQKELIFPKNHKLVTQLRDFRYETTDGGAVKLHHSEYGHDDYCDALALAAQGAKQGGYIVDW